MFPTAFRSPLLLTASLSAGLGVGWGVRWWQGPGSGHALAGGNLTVLGPEGVPAPGGAVPFSMERFHAASGMVMHRMLAQVLPGADAPLVRALAEDLAARPEFPTEAVWKAVLNRWVAVDAPGALAGVGLVDEQRREDFVKFVVKRWAETDLEAALAAAMAGGKDDELLEVHQVIAKTDPARALGLFNIRKKSGKVEAWSNSQFATMVFRNWGAKDPHAAAAYLMGEYQQDPESTSGPRWESLATGWAEKDPEGCRIWLTGLKDPLLKCAIAGLREAAETNPAGVAKVLGVVSLNDETRDTFMEVAAEWAARDAPSAMAWVKERFPGGAPRNSALGKVAETLMKSDLRAAVALLDEIGWDAASASPNNAGRVVMPGAAGAEEIAINDPFSPRPSSEVVMEQLGKEDPALALRYVEKASPAGQIPLLRTFVPAWFQRDPEAVTRWLETLPPEKLETKDLTGFLMDLPGLNSEKAKALAGRLPPGNLQEALAGLAFRRVDLDDPAKAVESIPFTDPASRQAALEQIVFGWSTAAPQAALDRLVGEAAASPGICQEVVEKWTLHDPSAASTWVAAQPPGPNRDGAIRGLALQLINEKGQPDFPAALVWSLSITDAEARLETAQSVLEKWPGNSREAAEMRAALESTTALPELDRQTLLQRLTP